MTAQHQTPLRFITAGSVDDGKSTLIGRLLYDSKALLSDQIKTLESGKSKGLKETIDFSILTDGLEAEREQGITIDVAYRYFSTAKRKFIIADTPGHEQYTRNMVTGASTASAAVVLVDASQLDFGAQPLQLLPQTKRHSAILRQLNCPHIVVAVNKMDLLDYSEDKFNAIVEAYRRLAEQLGLKDAHFVPVSALLGDNIVYPGGNMPWYKGEPLLSILETLPGADEVSRTADDFYFPVQLVVRQDADKADDFRGYQGRIERGSVAVGQTVRIEPNGLTAEVSEIITPKGEVAQAFAGEAATLRLDRDIDVSRGDLFVDKNSPLAPQKHLEVTLCWFDERPLNTARKYLLKHGTQTVSAKVGEIESVLDVRTLEPRYAEHKSAITASAARNHAAPVGAGRGTMGVAVRLRLGKSRKRGICRTARASDGIADGRTFFRNRPFRLANRQCEIRCRQSGGQPGSRRHPSQSRRTERL